MRKAFVPTRPFIPSAVWGVGVVGGAVVICEGAPAAATRPLATALMFLLPVVAIWVISALVRPSWKASRILIATGIGLLTFVEAYLLWLIAADVRFG